MPMINLGEPLKVLFRTQPQWAGERNFGLEETLFWRLRFFLARPIETSTVQVTSAAVAEIIDTARPPPNTSPTLT